MSILDISSNMLDVGGGPSTFYSDMNRLGPGVTGALWFNLYWILLSVLGLLIAGAVWNRGSKTSLLSRVKTARREVPKSYRSVILIATILWLGVAGNVYYNTQILNPYRTGEEQEQLMAAFEKKYSKYKGAVHPKVTDAKYYIDIFPNERDIHV